MQPENVLVYALLGLGALTALWIFFRILPLGLWATAQLSGTRISLIQLTLMRFRKVSPGIITNALINGHKAGLVLSHDGWEVHLMDKGVRKKLYSLFITLHIFNIIDAQIIFQKTINQGATANYQQSIQQTSDGGYIATGKNNSGKVYLYRTNVNGGMIWTKTYGAGGNFEFGNSVQQTNDGGFIVVGKTDNFGAGGSDVYIIKTNSNGDTLWTKTIGGLGVEYANSVQQTTDSCYVIVGATDSYGKGIQDIYLMKLNNNGNIIWMKTYGGIGVDVGYFVRQTSDKGYIIAGYTDSYGTGNYDAYLIKTNVNGNTLWSKTFGGVNIDYAFCVQQTNDTGYIISGTTESFGSGNADVYLIKTDINGNVVWSKTYGGIDREFGYYIQQDKMDSSYIVTGYTKSFGAGNRDVYALKTKFNGDTLWTKTYGGINDDVGYTIGQTLDSGYIIAAYTGSFGSGNDLYLIKTDKTGSSGCNQFNTNTIINNPLTLFNAGVMVDSGGIINSTPAIVLNPITTINPLCGITKASEIKNNNSPIQVYPNPTNKIITIELSPIANESTIAIYNIKGQELVKQKIKENKTQIDLSNLTNGIYIIKLANDKIVEVRKIIKE